MQSKKALIFLPPISMSPTNELTICHVKRLHNDYKIYSLGLGREIVRTQFNLTGSRLMHFYTLAKQRQFNRIIPYQEMLILNRNNKKSRNYLDINIKNFNDGVMSSLASKHRITSLEELTPYWQKQYHKLINDSRLIFESTVDFLKQYEINLVGAFNGRFFDSSAFIKAAKFCNVDYFVYDVNKSKSQYYFFNVSLHDIKANQEKAKRFFEPQNIFHLKTAEEYFHKRRYGKRTYEKSYTSGQEIGLIPNSIDKSKKIIAIYPSSDDEYRFLSDSFKMKCLDQVNEIRGIAENLRYSSDRFQILVRMHPNMINMPIKTLKNYYDLEKENEIINVLKPLDPYDTYAILDVAYAVIGFCSSIIFESAYYQKNTILIGPSPYLGLNLGNQFLSGKEAADHLSSKKDFCKPNKQNAIMWAVYINLHNDELKGFSLDNSIPKVYGKQISPLTFWRLLASISKLKNEIIFDNYSSLNFIQKFRFFLKRFSFILKSKWYV